MPRMRCYGIAAHAAYASAAAAAPRALRYRICLAQQHQRRFRARTRLRAAPCRCLMLARFCAPCACLQRAPPARLSGVYALLRDTRACRAAIDYAIHTLSIATMPLYIWRRHSRLQPTLPLRHASHDFVVMLPFAMLIACRGAARLFHALQFAREILICYYRGGASRHVATRGHMAGALHSAIRRFSSFMLARIFAFHIRCCRVAAVSFAAATLFRHAAAACHAAAPDFEAVRCRRLIATLMPRATPRLPPFAPADYYRACRSFAPAHAHFVRHATL